MAVEDRRGTTTATSFGSGYGATRRAGAASSSAAYSESEATGFPTIAKLAFSPWAH